MQEDVFGVLPWQLLLLCAHCWGQSEKGLVGHQWPVSRAPLSVILWSEPRAVLLKTFSRDLWGQKEKVLFGANLQFLPSISVIVKHKNPAGSLCCH